MQPIIKSNRNGFHSARSIIFAQPVPLSTMLLSVVMLPSCQFDVRAYNTSQPSVKQEAPPEVPVATVSPAATPFCAPPSGSVPSTSLCEDFAGIEEGQLPAGWRGGEGLMVRRSEKFTWPSIGGLDGLNVLGEFDRSRNLTFTVPWMLRGDYVLEWFTSVVGRCLAVTILPQGPKVQASASFDGTGQVAMNELAEKRIELRHAFQHFSLSRTGNVFKLLVDSEKALVGRYEVAVDSVGLKFDACDDASLRVGGIRLKRRSSADQ